MNATPRVRGHVAARQFSAVAKKPAQSTTKIPGVAAPQRWALRSLLLASATGVFLSPDAGWSQSAPTPTALPTGGQVKAGSASINQSGAAMTVNQGSQKAIINWQTFNIGGQASVTFQQPNAGAVALNRVLSTSPSQIYGQLNANGQVFLINPSGITFAPGAQVDVGGLVASTLNIKDADFLAGNYSFTRDGSTGAVVNQGTIKATAGGYIGLLAPEVRNEGIVSAQLGTVVLAAGEKVTMTFADSGNVSVQVDPATVRTLIENRNLISAPDGRILMSAKAATVLLGGTINNSGVVEADSLVANGGVVTLEASSAITNTGTISASGAIAGGVGDGGSIRLVSDGTTTVGGIIAARGGAAGGNGGTVETSGHVVDISGVKVDTTAPNGKTGNWLLDPYDLTVTDASGSTTVTPSGGTYTSGASGSTVTNNDVNTALATTNVTLQTGGSAGDGHGNGDIFVNGAISWSSGNSLTMNAFRDINVNANVTHSGSTGALALNPNTGAGGGNLNVASGFSVTLSGGTSLSIGGTPYTLITTPGQLQAVAGDLSGHYAVANDLDMSGFAFTPIGTGGTGPTNFSGVFEGFGHSIANLTIDQPAASYVGLFGANTGLLNDVHVDRVAVTGVMDVGGLAGFNAGLVRNSEVTGTVLGGSGSSSFSFGGLIGCNCQAVNGFAFGTVVNSYSMANVSGGSGAGGIGGLVGTNQGGIIGSFTMGGTVTGGSASSNVGGLAGTNVSNQHGINATISQSFAQDTVGAGDGSTAVGGLVGFNNSIINGGSYARGTVTAGANASQIGGLVGANTIVGALNAGGVIDNASAIGSVAAGSGSQQIGGLAGYNLGTITNSFSVTTVTAAAGTSLVGGLVGLNDHQSTYTGTISNSYSLSTVKSGSGASQIGGLVGGNLGRITNSFFSFGGLGTIIAGSANNMVGGIAGNNASTGVIDHTPSFAAMTVADGSDIGGVAGVNNGLITNGTYWRADDGITVVGPGGYVGGLVGGNGQTGVIDGASAIGLISIGPPIFGTSTGTSGAIIGGLVGSNNGTIQNSYTNVNIQVQNETQYVGGLAGTNGNGLGTNAVISNSYALGTITGTGFVSQVGGLVGWNLPFFTNASGGGANYLPGTITNSFSQVTINGGTQDIGGLVGQNSGTIDSSHTFGGQVIVGTHTMGIGGLIGRNQGIITNSYNSATVQAGSASNGVGGLVGINQQTITGSYSTASVTAGDGSQNVGGLVGDNQGAILSSYVNNSGATVSAGNGSSNVGGLAGHSVNSNGGVAIDSSYAVISVQAGSASTGVGGLVGESAGTISQSWASAPVTAGDNSQNIGGLVGLNHTTITGSSAFGSVTAGNGAQNVGGLIGQAFGNALQATNSSASGNVTVGSSGNAIGSLIGLLSSGGTVTSSAGTGTVSAGPGSTNVGGQIGQTSP